ncbi:MAG: hypothetical protein ABSG84_16585 [Acidobacteriaceae bacterium]|jgi:hypothetical protein
MRPEPIASRRYSSRERTALIILILTFITLFLAVFSPSLVFIHKCEQAKEFNAWKERQQGRIEAENERVWRRSKQMILS